jgi:ABC-type uncharacterized transport system auxiliary subunit
MKKYALLLSLIIFLSGCWSSHARRYYQFHLGEEVEPDTKTIQKTILIERIEVDDLYDEFRMVYRVSPYEMNYYSYEFWADKPATLIRDSITHWLLRKNLFKKVTQQISGGEPDILWISKIHIIEEIDTPGAWYARLSMEIELFDFRSKESLYYHRFDRKEKLVTKSVALVPVVLSNILEEELTKVVKDIHLKFE